MNIKELIELGEPIFKQIDEAYESRRSFNALNNSEQPKEWIKELVSDSTGKVYYHNDIELIEAICDRLCYDWGYEIKQTIVTPTKSGVIITVTVQSIFHFNYDSFTLIKDGIASQYVSSASFIELAAAKCASVAFKNSAKKIGNLWGKSLNRNLEDAPIEAQDIFVDEKSDFQKKVDACNTIENLAALKKSLTPAQMKVYMDKLKELSKKI